MVILEFVRMLGMGLSIGLSGIWVRVAKWDLLVDISAIARYDSTSIVSFWFWNSNSSILFISST